MSPRKKLRAICNKISTQTWKSWCRLCAKSDMGAIKTEHAEQTNGECESNWLAMDTELQENHLDEFNLSAAIEKFLGINIYGDKDLPQSVCSNCYSLLKTMMNFIQRTERVQRKYADLKRLGTKKSTFELSTKYGLVENQKHSGISEKGNSTKAKKICQINKMEEVLLKAESPCDDIGKVECLFIAATEENIQPESFVNNTSMQTDDGDPFDETELSRNLNNVDGGLMTEKLTPTDIDWADNTISDNKESSDLLEPMSIKRKYCGKNQSGDEEDSITKASERFSCALCSLQFKRETSLFRHIDRRHANNSEISFACNQCERTFAERYKLKEHLDMHLPIEMRRIHSCLYCDKKSASRNSLRRHIKEMHLRKQSVICHQCGAALRNFNNLRSHLLTHLDYAPLECHICQRRFKIRQSLKRHMKVHDPKKYDCPECGLQLKSILTLRTHMVVHSDNKPYKCKVCGAAFKRLKTCKNHEILHSGVKPYSCEFCDRTFPISSALRTHKKNTHPVELAAAEAAASGVAGSKSQPVKISK